MSDQRPALILAVVGTVGIATLAFAIHKNEPPSAAPPTASAAEVAMDAGEPSIPRPIEYPSGAAVELAILTDASKEDLDAFATPDAAPVLLETRHCGDPDACDAIREFFQGEAELDVQVLAPNAWPLASDLSEVAATLSKAERDSLVRRKVIVVRVAGEAFPQQLPVRAGFALAAALAEKTNGVVYDRALGRIERAHLFASRVIAAPLGGDAFRRDAIKIDTKARSDGTLRLVTAGMARFGVPDLESLAVDKASAPAVAEIMYAVADAITAERATSPVTITLGDLERVRGAPFAEDAGLPDVIPVSIDVETIHAEADDPSPSMARIVPSGGATTDGYRELVATFFGGAAPPLDPTDDQVRITKEKTQNALEDALTTWKKTRGATLSLQIPFRYGDDGGVQGNEYMWMAVRSFDKNNVTGTLVDDAVRAGMKKGQAVTRPRGEVTDYQVVLPDGGVGMP